MNAVPFSLTMTAGWCVCACMCVRTRVCQFENQHPWTTSYEAATICLLIFCLLPLQVSCVREGFFLFFLSITHLSSSLNWIYEVHHSSEMVVISFPTLWGLTVLYWSVKQKVMTNLFLSYFGPPRSGLTASQVHLFIIFRTFHPRSSIQYFDHVHLKAEYGHISTEMYIPIALVIAWVWTLQGKGLTFQSVLVLFH